MTAELRRKLADIIPRLASDSKGEILATAAAIGRVLEGAGLDLHDLAALIATGPEEPPEWRPTDFTPEWRIQVETALRLSLWRNDWELDFLHGLRDWSGNTISEKQQSVLWRISARGNFDE
jgi:hypothetical protein